MKILNPLVMLIFLSSFEEFSNISITSINASEDTSEDESSHNSVRKIRKQPSNIFEETIFERMASIDLIVTEKHPGNSYDRLVQRQLMRKHINIPNNLYEPHSALMNILSEVDRSNIPDIVDIIFLIEANGKSQSLFLTKFLAKLEDSIEEKFKVRYPDIKLTLSFPVDTFVGAGSGAIPAALAALSRDHLSSYVPVITLMSSNIYRPKASCDCCGCLGATQKLAKDFVSAYQGDSPVIIDDDSSDWDKFVVDEFDFKREGAVNLINMFGGYTRSDLQSTLEVISLPISDSSNILEMVTSAMAARSIDNKKNVKYINVADAFDKASSILENIQLDAKGRRVTASAMNLLEKMNLVSMNDERRCGSIQELKSILTSNSKIKRNLILVSLASETSSQIPGISHAIPITSNFFSNVHYARNNFKIVTFNYKFFIPEYIYEGNYSKAMDSAIEAIFSNNRKTEAPSSTTVATGMLIDFLTVCNAKTLSVIEEDSETRELLSIGLSPLVESSTIGSFDLPMPQYEGDSDKDESLTI